MTEQEIHEALTDQHALACTMHAEAAGDRTEGGSSIEERLAVGCVIRNRLRMPLRFGDTYRDVCLKERQFSCWIAAGGTANYQRTLQYAYLLVTQQPVGESLFAETLWLAAGVMTGIVVDQTRGATHYYAPAAMRPPGAVPSWAAGQQPVAMIGAQHFFRGV